MKQTLRSHRVAAVPLATIIAAAALQRQVRHAPLQISCLSPHELVNGATAIRANCRYAPAIVSLDAAQIISTLHILFYTARRRTTAMRCKKRLLHSAVHSRTKVVYAYRTALFTMLCALPELAQPLAPPRTPLFPTNLPIYSNTGTHVQITRKSHGSDMITHAHTHTHKFP